MGPTISHYGARGSLLAPHSYPRQGGTLYVLGWRWDCEATAQVWSNCADVTLVAQDEALV